MVFAALSAAFCLVPTPSHVSNADTLKKQLNSIASVFHGTLGYSFHHLKRGDKLELRGDESFPTASTIKLAVLCTAMEKNQEGKMGYFDTREFTELDKRGGAGFIQNYKIGAKLELKELLHLMITISDNSATSMMV